MDEEKFEKTLREKGVSFDAIKLKKTIGDVKDIDEDFKEQLKDLKD